MTPVEFKFVLPTGEPMANATVDIKLGRASHTGSLTGITMPRPITVQTDAAGKAVLSLWPSATAYFVEVLDAASEAGIFYKFLVPEVAPGVTVRLQDLVVDAPMSGVFYDDAALLAIHNSKVNARASELAAKDWAALAASKAQDMTSFVVATTANKDAAALSEFNANAKAVEAAASAAAALGSKNAAATSEANALASKNAAAGSATTAATKATEAASSATAADASKTAAGTSATNAANSATAAQASKDSAQTSATTATTKATEASSSATAAASSAATASTKATEAGNSANAAATSASQAAASAAAAAAAGVSSFNTRTGAVSLTQADVFAALGYTPYNATNPNGYITAAGNVATATKLATARTINGVPFDGSANITITDDTKLSLLATAAAAAKLGAARTLTIGATGKSFDGSANVAWSLAEIGALPLAGGTLTGGLTISSGGLTVTGGSVAGNLNGAVLAKDTRGTNPAAGTHGTGLSVDFKQNGIDGLSDGGGYHGVVTIQQYSDPTGGGVRQLAFTDNDNLWIRGSGAAWNAWGAWKLLLNSSNVGSYALPISGGTLTGNLATTGALSLPNNSIGSGGGGYTGPARFGLFDRVAGSAVLQLGGPDNARGFELIDRDWTTVILGASMSAFTYKGNTVWHSGNFTPSAMMQYLGWGNTDLNSLGFSNSRTGFTYSNNAPWTGPFASFQADGYELQLNASYGGNGDGFSFRTRQGDGGYWNPWKTIWHSGNFDAARPSVARVICGFDPTVDQAIGCSNWFRSSGNTGWYNQTHGGGINMEDHLFVRVSHGKHFLSQERLFGNGGGQGLGAITVSTSGPSGGRVGDIWIQY